MESSMVRAPSSIPGMRWECISVITDEKSVEDFEGFDLENKFLNTIKPSY
jgi:hypothetical protein